MMEIIFLIIFLVSLIGMGVIVWRKIPLLSDLPETVPAGFDWKKVVVKAKNATPLNRFSSNIFLQKILSKTRVIILKTDNKTSNWLQKLREKSQKDKFGENDNYWEEIKNSTKETKAKKK